MNHVMPRGTRFFSALLDFSVMMNHVMPRGARLFIDESHRVEG